MPVRAVLFDVIGTTVLEDGDVVKDCFRNAFAAVGIAIDDGAISENRGRDKKEAIRHILSAPAHPHISKQKVFMQFKQELKNNLHRFRENDDLRSLLEFLRKKKVYTGIGTGLPRDIFNDIFDHLQWNQHRFDYIGIAEEIGKGRPHPHMINDMRRRLNVAGNEFLKVGDTVADIEEGRNANVMAVALLSGTVASALVLDAKPNFAITNLAELPQVVLSL